VTSPCPRGQNTAISVQDATCVALPTNQPINRREYRRLDARDNESSRFIDLRLTRHHRCARGVDPDGMSTRWRWRAAAKPIFLRRALTWNPDGILGRRRHLTIGGHYAYIMAKKGLVIVNLDQPLQPRVESFVPAGRRPASPCNSLSVRHRRTRAPRDRCHGSEASAHHRCQSRAARDGRALSGENVRIRRSRRQGLAIVDISVPSTCVCDERFQ